MPSVNGARCSANRHDGGVAAATAALSGSLVGRRYATLAQAAATLADGRLGASTANPSPRIAEVRRRYVANCLGELDRFLHLLIDEVAGQTPAVTRQRHAANKIAWIAPARWEAGGDRQRLHALARTRACLIYCSGIVTRGDQRQGSRMTTGWLCPVSAELQTFPLGAQLKPAARELADVGTFYRLLADRIVA